MCWTAWKPACGGSLSLEKRRADLGMGRRYLTTGDVSGLGSRVSIWRSDRLKNMPRVTSREMAPMPRTVGTSPARWTTTPTRAAPIGDAGLLRWATAPRCHHCANRGCSLERQPGVRLGDPGWATIKSGWEEAASW